MFHRSMLAPLTLIRLTCVVVLIAIVLFGKIASSANWAQVLTNAAHGPVCALIAVILLMVRRSTATPPQALSRDAAGSSVATTLIAIAIELIQSQIGRDAEVDDVVTGFLGACAGTGAYVLWHQWRAHTHRQRWLWSLITVLSTVIVATPVVRMAAAYIASNLRSPVLVDANAPLGTYFLTSYWLKTRVEPLPDRWQLPQQHEAGYLVPLDTLTDPSHTWGLSVQEFDIDWRSRQALAFEIVNPAPEPLQLKLRIFDTPDGLGNNRQRFFRTLTVPAHTRRIVAVSTGDMASGVGTNPIDLSHVYGFVIDGAPGNRARTFYLLRIWLR